MHSFAGGSDGAGPYAALVADSAGNFYGTTQSGGANDQGTVYKITSAGVHTLLHSFDGAGSDGAFPYAGLIADGAGNFYGTTLTGASGQGTVYKISSAGDFTLLHTFGGSDGAAPFAGLVADGADNFYGTTFAGGASNQGAVYKITSAGAHTLLHSFDGSNGAYPTAALVADGAGSFYGTTQNGGAYGKGTIFRTPAQ